MQGVPKAITDKCIALKARDAMWSLLGIKNKDIPERIIYLNGSPIAYHVTAMYDLMATVAPIDVLGKFEVVDVDEE